jgi:hypothetical protein
MPLYGQSSGSPRRFNALSCFNVRAKSKNLAAPAVKREAEEDWNEMTHRKRAQKLSLGSLLRPKSKEIVVCHDP